MPNRRRSVIAPRFYAGFNIAETAQVMGWPKGRVSVGLDDRRALAPRRGAPGGPLPPRRAHGGRRLLHRGDRQGRSCLDCADPPPYTDFRMSLRAVDATTGALRWEHDDLPLYANLYTHIEGGQVIVANGSSGESFDVATGVAGPRPPGTVPVPLTSVGVRSTAPVPSDLSLGTALDGPMQAGDLNVVVSGTDVESPGALVAYDPTTGGRRWSYPLDRPSHSPPLVVGGLVLVTTGDNTPNCG